MLLGIKFTYYLRYQLKYSLIQLIFLSAACQYFKVTKARSQASSSTGTARWWVRRLLTEAPNCGTLAAPHAWLRLLDTLTRLPIYILVQGFPMEREVPLIHCYCTTVSLSMFQHTQVVFRAAALVRRVVVRLFKVF